MTLRELSAYWGKSFAETGKLIDAAIASGLMERVTVRRTSRSGITHSTPVWREVKPKDKS
jgi:hypothetical protein